MQRLIDYAAAAAVEGASTSWRVGQIPRRSSLVELLMGLIGDSETK